MEEEHLLLNRSFVAGLLNAGSVKMDIQDGEDRFNVSAWESL